MVWRTCQRYHITFICVNQQDMDTRAPLTEFNSMDSQMSTTTSSWAPVLRRQTLKWASPVKHKMSSRLCLTTEREKLLKMDGLKTKSKYYPALTRRERKLSSTRMKSPRNSSQTNLLVLNPHSLRLAPLPPQTHLKLMMALQSLC